MKEKTPTNPRGAGRKRLGNARINICSLPSELVTKVNKNLTKEQIRVIFVLAVNKKLSQLKPEQHD